MMRTITTQGTVMPDGTLKIELPSTGLPAGQVDAVIVLQQAPGASAQRGSACSGLFLGKLPEDLDIDAALHDMRHQWEEEIEP